MAQLNRESEIVETFVKMADTLVGGYDVVDLLDALVARCARILDAVDAGILLPSASGALEVVASTSERGRLIGLLQLSAEEGPCVEAYETGRVVTVDSIEATAARWPRFAASAAELGYASTHAIPLRLREEVIGSLNLYRDEAGPLNEPDAVVGQALADVATIGILHERSIRESTAVRDQLQTALTSRVVIEQAKGVLAYSLNVDTAAAFAELRGRARGSGRRLTDVAREIVEEASGGAPRLVP